MYTSLGALGWNMGRGQPLVETTGYKQSLLSGPFSFTVQPEHVIFGEGEKECLILQKWQTAFCEIIIGMVWKGGVYKEEKKIPLEKKCGACHITMQHWFTALQWHVYQKLFPFAPKRMN